MTEAKPNPEGYLLLAKTLGLEPIRCVVFEDSLAGLKAAKAAGMQTVGVTHSCPDVSIISPYADTLISDYHDRSRPSSVGVPSADSRSGLWSLETPVGSA